MPWTRQLPSGLWASTVRTPAGRITQTHKLKSVITAWAADLEADVRRADFIDPRKGDTTVGEWWEECHGKRHLERASRKRDQSHWRVHVAPRWAKVPLNGVLKPDVEEWVTKMADPKRKPKPVGAATIEGAVGVLRALFDQAIAAKMGIRVNPASNVSKPRRNAHVDRVLDVDEEKELVARAHERFPDRLDAGLFIELLLDTGLRWEEAAAIPPEMINAKRQRIQIAWVLERDGTARPYAKSDAGNRPVAYGDALAKRIAAAKLAAKTVEGVFPEGGPTRLVFTGGSGSVLRYDNWHPRVWRKVLFDEVSVEPKPRPKGKPGPAPRAVERVPYLEDPQPTPHDLRHTFGTRLADEGVPIHDIMALMGHEDIRSAQRYLHSSEERFKRARKALDKVRKPAPKQRGRESAVSRDLETPSTPSTPSTRKRAGQVT